MDVWCLGGSRMERGDVRFVQPAVFTAARTAGVFSVSRLVRLVVGPISSGFLLGTWCFSSDWPVLSCKSAEPYSSRYVTRSVTSLPFLTRRVAEQVKKIATDKLREAFKDVQPQLEQPYRNNSTATSEKPVRVTSEFNRLKAGADAALPEK